MALSVPELREIVGRFPRAGLAALPTPLEPCPRLSGVLGIPVAVKRDDLTGLAFGGNKTRQLELILGQALRQKPDVLITMAAVQSNQCRQTAAAARKLGLQVHLVLRGAMPEVPDANLLLDRLLGADIQVLPPEASAAEINAAVGQLAARLRSEGHRPRVVDLMNDESEDQELAAIAYTLMVAELVEQMGGAGNGPAWIYLSSGSGGSATQAGTWIGCRLLGLDSRVVGVTAAATDERVRDQTLEIARRTVGRLGLSPTLIDDTRTMIVERGYVGEGYGLPTGEGLEAMRLAARSEGLLLDPVYTGKALAAMIGHVREGRIAAGDSAVFVHTGGTPLTFLYQLGPQIAGEV